MTFGLRIAIISLLLSSCCNLCGCTQNTPPEHQNSQKEKQVPMKENQASPKYNQLTPEEEQVIVHKGTERPFSGTYCQSTDKGTYVCKRCNTPLYRSDDKFDSHCGWPSFDDEIPGAVKRITDADGRRTEILCTHCGGHLGHVFTGEGLTKKSVRHCVNSISLNFIPANAPVNEAPQSEVAIFAGGCFWGVEYHFQKAKGVLSTEVGYIGGNKDNPNYKQVCTDTTGHAEAIKVVFDPTQTNYEQMARLFFEIHDPTQLNGQGPDLGKQYRSAVFYTNDAQKAVAEKLVQLLKGRGYPVVTELNKAGTFWKAEEYHQSYYQKKGALPYCHKYTKRF